jgi:Acetyltransferases
MMCKELNSDALSELSKEYYVRNCGADELDIWKRIHYDDVETADKNYRYMTKFYDDVYGGREAEFYNKCIFVCDGNIPVGTCFMWEAYNNAATIHWFKVLKRYEGLGIGRALLSIVMESINENGYPVFLHTQPASFRAIKLYSDFGFHILTDPVIGRRKTTT